MKKTFLLTVLILSIVLGATAFAATETQKTEIKPDYFWNDGSDISYGFRTTTYNFDKGTLPTNETNNYMKAWTATNTAMGGTAQRFQCFGTGYVDGVDDVITASAARESEDSTNTEAYSNIVFKITGNQQTILADTVYQAGELADTRRHSVRFKLSENIPANGTAGLFVLSGDATNAGTVQSEGTGVYISNGGAYILDRLNGGREVWFIEENTLAANTWYTVDALVEILADGYIVQNVTIKDGTGTVVGKSDCYKVSSLEKSACGGNYNLLQLYTENLGSGTVMLDDWKTYAVTNTPARATSALTFVQDPDKATRRTYKFETGVTLDSARINNDLVTVTCVSDPTLNLTGKYTVTCENTAIVVTMDESLPMATKFKMEIDADKMLSMTDGYVAFDYSSTTVTDSMTQEFTTPALSEIFVTSFSGNTPSSTITLSNGDVVEHEYMIVASLVRAGKYLEFAATHGTLPARVSVSEPTEATALPIPSFTTPTASGDKIMIMVWDNWQDMNSYTDTIPEEISVP